MTRIAVAALAMLAGCSPEAQEPPANRSAAAMASPVAATPAVADLASAPIATWLVGTWSFEGNCGTDFLITYDADGRLDNSGETGRWALAGDTVTETITERLESGGEAPQKIDPAETRSYTVVRKDATHGVVTFKGKPVPILRC